MPAGAAADDDDDTTQCSQHPSSPGGGICPFCLQHKLGILVSSSSSSFLSTHPSSSSPPSTAAASTRYQPHNGVAMMPFLSTPKKKKRSSDTLAVLNRTRSTTAAARSAAPRFEDFSNSTPRRHRGFWSFLHHKKTEKPTTSAGPTPAQASTLTVAIVVDETDDSPNSSAGSNATASFDQKVSRSRSVGCGSRSFSGDFFERISTGLGDCTLRRVESQREGTQKHRHSTTSATMREKVRCGGLFGGFTMITSSSSSSTTSSSGYWASGEPNGRPIGPVVQGKSRSWGWAFGSPRRAPGGGGGKASSAMVKDNNVKTPNLAAIPSLLAVKG